MTNIKGLIVHTSTIVEQTYIPKVIVQERNIKFTKTNYIGDHTKN